ncbi:hypothetical protein WI41_21645 [Burkholderia latens]|uniref:Uncharacterized protein n=1 Tax=Burkholderia latens TaxID=488446 RepID=A0AAP1G8T4_9BURK|nr:hypothetical protein WI41_21645 [Burkholderia latens]
MRGSVFARAGTGTGRNNRRRERCDAMPGAARRRLSQKCHERDYNAGRSADQSRWSDDARRARAN